MKKIMCLMVFIILCSFTLGFDIYDYSSRAYYWTADDSNQTLTTMHDVLGNGSLTTDATTGAVGQINEAHTYDGVDNDARNSSIISAQNLGDFTIGTWFKPNECLATFVVSAEMAADPTELLGMYLNTNGTACNLAAFTQDGVNSQDRLSSDYGSIILDNWNFGVITSNGSVGTTAGLNVFINGVDVDTTATSTKNHGTNVRFDSIRIGFSNRYGEYFNGSIDEVTVFRSILKPAEILDWYNQGVAGYRLDEEIPTPLSITDINCTSPPTDDTTPFITTDTTPTYSLTTNFAVNCSISNTNSSYALCSTTNSTHHICTINTTQEFNLGSNYAYFNCSSNTVINNITARYLTLVSGYGTNISGLHFYPNVSKFNPITMTFTDYNVSAVNQTSTNWYYKFCSDTTGSLVGWMNASNVNFNLKCNTTYANALISKPINSSINKTLNGSMASGSCNNIYCVVDFVNISQAFYFQEYWDVI